MVVNYLINIYLLCYTASDPTLHSVSFGISHPFCFQDSKSPHFLSQITIFLIHLRETWNLLKLTIVYSNPWFTISLTSALLENQTPMLTAWYLKPTTFFFQCFKDFDKKYIDWTDFYFFTVSSSLLPLSLTVCRCYKFRKEEGQLCSKMGLLRLFSTAALSILSVNGGTEFRRIRDSAPFRPPE